MVSSAPVYALRSSLESSTLRLDIVAIWTGAASVKFVVPDGTAVESCSSRTSETKSGLSIIVLDMQIVIARVA